MNATMKKQYFISLIACLLILFNAQAQVANDQRKVLSEIVCGDMAFQYLLDTGTKNVGLLAVPADLVQKIDTSKKYSVISLVQVKLQREDGFVGLFGRGKTMLNSLSSCGFTYDKQTVQETDSGKTIVTFLKNKNNCLLEHHLVWHRGEKAVVMYSVFRNESGADVTLEMLSSFSLGALTPFQAGDTPNTLVMHRIRSRWADEGRLESTPVEDLQLEPSDTHVSANVVRYGQTGSMPVREYFPFIAIEDTKEGVSWGAQVAWPGSWQIEAYRLDDALQLCGGLADRLFGQWMKTIKQGEQFTSPQAVLSVTKGGVDDVSQRLTSMQYETWKKEPQVEQEAPAMFSDWAMTWGNNNEKIIERCINAVKDKGITYFYIDAGASDASGNWVPDAKRFPDMEKTIKMVKDAGMVPGWWFEYECCEKGAETFDSQQDHSLRLDGQVIFEYNRHFWDMRDPYTQDYLTKTVIGTLKKYGIGIFEIDYNGNIGMGCDGAESPGEGLRQNMEGMLHFVGKVRKEIPGIIIDNCSSGGHRLEPCMIGLTSYSSGSDVLDSVYAPILAANLHRVLLPCKEKIWTVVRPTDSPQKLYYVMATALLGRPCLSGDVDKIDSTQWDTVEKGIAFYHKITPVLIHGHTYRYGPTVKSYRHPEGWQGILRVSDDKKEAYAVIHKFAGENGSPIRMELPAGLSFELAETYMENPNAVKLRNNTLEIKSTGEFQGFAVRMKCH